MCGGEEREGELSNMLRARKMQYPCESNPSPIPIPSLPSPFQFSPSLSPCVLFPPSITPLRHRCSWIYNFATKKSCPKGFIQYTFKLLILPLNPLWFSELWSPLGLSVPYMYVVVKYGWGKLWSCSIQSGTTVWPSPLHPRTRSLR